MYCTTQSLTVAVTFDLLNWKFNLHTHNPVLRNAHTHIGFSTTFVLKFSASTMFIDWRKETIDNAAYYYGDTATI